MLSTSDIRPYVEAVLRLADNSLSPYQILERLPAEIRDQIIAERGMPGLGSGNSYSAASLVTDTVEILLPSKEPPYRIYVDTGNATFQVAGQTIQAGNAAVAFYRLPRGQGVDQPASAPIQSPQPMEGAPLVLPTSAAPTPPPGVATPVAAQKKTSPWLVVLLVLFYPAGIVYLLYLLYKQVW